MIQWVEDYWWIILLILIGMFINGIKALMRIDVTPYIKAREKQDELLKQQLEERQKKAESQHKS